MERRKSEEQGFALNGISGAAKEWFTWAVLELSVSVLQSYTKALQREKEIK